MTYIPEALRQQVSKRAGGRCEYCLIDERYVLKSHEVDHIRAEKHGGETILENLCLSCFECNRHKGSDLSSVDPITDDVAPLFHPRRDEWHEHFRLSAAGTIEAFLPPDALPFGCSTSTIVNELRSAWRLPPWGGGRRNLTRIKDHNRVPAPPYPAPLPALPQTPSFGVQ